MPFPGETFDLGFVPRFLRHDGKRMAYYAEVRDTAGQNHHRLKVWDWETGRELLSVSDLGGLVSRFGACFDGRAERLAVFIKRPGSAGGDLKIWETDNGKELLMIPLAGDRAPSIAISQDGTHVAALILPDARRAQGPPARSRSGRWDRARRCRGSRACRNGRAWIYSPDGRSLLVGGIRADSSCVLDLKSGARLLELAGGSEFWSFSPDGTHVVGYSADGKLRIWDMRAGDRATGRPPIRVVEVNLLGIPDLGFSSDGRYFSCAFGGTISICEVEPRDNRTVVFGRASTGAIYPAASADASRFAGAFETDVMTEIKVWDVTGKVVFTASDSPVGTQVQRQVLFSRDGLRLAYSAWDRNRVDGKVKMLSRLRVWDIRAGANCSAAKATAAITIPRTSVQTADAWRPCGFGIAS